MDEPELWGILKINQDHINAVENTRREGISYHHQ